jgi:plastocyanin
VEPGGGDTGRIRGRQSVTVRFDTPGEFRFRCTIHPSMQGKVVIEP